MASLPFTAVADGTVTVLRANLADTGWVRIFHADNSVGAWTPITAPTTVVPVLAGDLVVQRLNRNGTALLVFMIISAVTP
jgi:hypothetical protein